MSTEAQRPSPEGTHSRLRKVWSGPGFGECPRPVTLSRLEGLERSRHAWTPVVLPAPASHKAPVTCYHERHKLRFSASVNHCAPGPTFSCLECGAGPAAPGQVLEGEQREGERRRRKQGKARRAGHARGPPGTHTPRARSRVSSEERTPAPHSVVGSHCGEGVSTASWPLGRGTRGSVPTPAPRRTLQVASPGPGPALLRTPGLAPHPAGQVGFPAPSHSRRAPAPSLPALGPQPPEATFPAALRTRPRLPGPRKVGTSLRGSCKNLRGAWGTQSAERPALHLSSGLDLGFLSSSPASGSTLGCSLLNK